MDWNALDGLPPGPDWRLRLRVETTGERRYEYDPPNIVERFWAWPVGFVILAVLGSLEPLPPPVAFFAGGAGVVALWNETRMAVVRQNHLTLCQALIEARTSSTTITDLAR